MERLIPDWIGDHSTLITRCRPDASKGDSRGTDGAALNR